MKDHTEMDDFTFENQFETGKFPPNLFNHEAHLRLAWIHLQKYGEAQAIENITTQLLNYVEALGAKDKYHHTLTIAAIKAVNHFKNKSQSSDFQLFIIENPQLKLKFKELMAAHYSMDIFQSEQARITYLAPDLLPFD